MVKLELMKILTEKKRKRKRKRRNLVQNNGKGNALNAMNLWEQHNRERYII